MHIRAGGPLSGAVIRSLRSTARTRVETFRALFDGERVEEWDLPGADELRVGEFHFDGVVGEPLLLWDGTLDAANVAEVEAFFSGNVDRDEPQVERVIDATAAATLPDEEFWPIIESLGRRTWESTIRKAERLAADQGVEFAIRWAQTAALKALQLADVIDAAGWEARQQIDVIGATLAQGRDVFSKVRDNPAAFDHRWLADLSGQTIWIGEGALDRLGARDESVRVETAFSSRHGAILDRAHADMERWQREYNIPEHDQGPSFRIARAVVRLASGYRERLILLVDAGTTVSTPAHDTAVVESFGGEVVAGLEFSNLGGLGRLFNVDIFTIKRRSTRPAVEYLAMHASTPVDDLIVKPVDRGV